MNVPAEQGRTAKGPTANSNIFEDPAIAESINSDPFGKFISENWKRIAGILVAVALVMIAYNSFNTTRLQRRAAATAMFAQIRAEYRTIVEKKRELSASTIGLGSVPEADKKGAEEKIAALQSELGGLREKAKLMLTSLDSPAPFDLLSRAYGGLVAAQFEDYEQTKNALLATPWDLVGRAGSTDRMLAEFAVLGLSKALSESGANLEIAKGALVKLAEKGEFAAVSAAEALAALAGTSDEKSKVKELLKSLETRAASQSKFIAEAREGL